MHFPGFEDVKIDVSAQLMKADFQCIGVEKDPNECPHRLAVSPSMAFGNCSHSMVVGITCLRHHVELRKGSGFNHTWTRYEISK